MKKPTVLLEKAVKCPLFSLKKPKVCHNSIEKVNNFKSKHPQLKCLAIGLLNIMFLQLHTIFAIQFISQFYE